MPPVHPPLKNDGPACRVCGCTEHNACVIAAHPDVLPLIEPVAHGVRIPATRIPRILTCSWVRTEANTPPLCSACSGTDADMAEAIARGVRLLEMCSARGIDMAVTIGKAALARRKKLQKST